MSLGLLARHFCHHTCDDLRRLCLLDDSKSGMLPLQNKKQRREADPDDAVLPALMQFDVNEILEKGTLLVASGPRLDANGDSAVSAITVQHSLSARERNQLKRKQRSHERGCTSPLPCGSDPASLISIASFKTEDGDEPAMDESILDGRWPFQKVYERLMADVMDPVWEVRHGAVLGLRELLTCQASCAGITVELVQEVPSGWAIPGKTTLRDITDVTEESVRENFLNNRRCLEACCAQILHLIVLDRMGDYLTDQMVAPVRETASQAFGCCLPSLPLETIQHFFTIIDQMVLNKTWEVRHSGYVLLKYLLTAHRSHHDVNRLSQASVGTCLMPDF